MQYVYTVIRHDREHTNYLAGVFDSKDKAMPTVERIRKEDEEAMIIQWEVNGRRVAWWDYNDDYDGTYNIYPIEE